MTREGFAYLRRQYVQSAAHTCSSLAGKQVSPHGLRHYLPGLTMSCGTK
jgi:hypothetical protein